MIHSRIIGYLLLCSSALHFFILAGENVDFKPIDLKHPITHCCLTEDGRHLIALHEQQDSVSVIDVSRGQLLKTVDLRAPRFVMARGDSVFIANYGLGTISILDTKNWTLSNELIVPQKSVYYLSAPRGTHFKNELLVTTGVRYQHKFYQVDVKTDSAKLLREEIHDSLATLSFRGESVVIQGEFTSSPMATAKSLPAATLSDRSVRHERGDHADTPLLYQVHDSILWFADTAVFSGLPPRIISQSKSWVIPDQTRMVFYELNKTAIKAMQANTNMALLEERGVSFADEPLPAVPNLRRSDYTLMPVAATLGDQTYILVPAKSRLLYGAIASFAGREALRVESFPSKVFVGEKVRVSLLPPGATGEFEVMNGPAVKVSKDGVLEWTPLASEAGACSIKIRCVSENKTRFLRYSTEVVTTAQQAVTQPGVQAPAAIAPAKISVEGTHHLSGSEASLHYSSGARSLLILDDDEARILDESGLNVRKKIKLKRRYKEIRERNGTLVALSDYSLDLIDIESGAEKKSIGFKDAKANSFDVHPKSEVSYVSWNEVGDGERRRDIREYQIAKVDETTGRMIPLRNCIGNMVAVHPGGKLLFIASSRLVDNSAVFQMYGLPMAGDYASIDSMMSYELVGDGARIKQLSSSPGANGRALRLSPCGEYVCYVSGGGYIKKRYYELPHFSINNFRAPISTFFTNAYPVDMAYHAALPLVAGTNGKVLKIFDRDTGDELASNLDTQGETLTDIRRLVFSPDGLRLLVRYQNSNKQHVVKAFGLKLTAEQRAKIDAYKPPVPVSLEELAAPPVQAIRREDIEALKSKPGTRSMKPKEVVSEFHKSVVIVKTPTGNGTGFFIGKEGYLLTCAHVIGFEGHMDVTISFPDSEGAVTSFEPARVSVLSTDFEQDLALVKLTTDKRMRPVRFDTAAVETGEEICILGHPGLGGKVLDYTLTNGLISNHNRVIDELTYFQTNAAVNPGSSGSPVFNSKGNVIGVVVMKTYLENTAFVIPLERVKAFVERLVTPGK